MTKSAVFSGIGQSATIIWRLEAYSQPSQTYNMILLRKQLLAERCWLLSQKFSSEMCNSILNISLRMAVVMILMAGIIFNLHNIITEWKVSEYGVFSGPYFLVFGLNGRKYRSEKTPYLDTFHAVNIIYVIWYNISNITSIMWYIWYKFYNFIIYTDLKYSKPCRFFRKGIVKRLRVLPFKVETEIWSAKTTQNNKTTAKTTIFT